MENGKVEVDDDMGDGMHCSEHPYRNNPGGICAFCLQEKLGKLVSSSFPLQLRSSSSSSTSPSFRSEAASGNNNGGACSVAVRPSLVKVRSETGEYNRHFHEYYSRRVRIPFMLAKKSRKMTVAESSSCGDRGDFVFHRSKSVNTVPGGRRSNQYCDVTRRANAYQDYSPRRRGFWSFLHLPSSKSKLEKSSTISMATKPKGLNQKEVFTSSASRKVRDEEEASVESSEAVSSFERKVSRSRSVGCGSRSFSGEFFERISTGFGDCTLRRVESQREGKPKGDSNMKERVRCGGLFGGFIITSTSSSSSSYWLSSSADEMAGKSTTPALANGRNRSWGWTFASPMRAFSKPANGRREPKAATPNLGSIPSILS